MHPSIKAAIDLALTLGADITIVVYGGAPNGLDWIYVCEHEPKFHTRKQTWAWSAPSLAEGVEARAYVMRFPYAFSYFMHGKAQPFEQATRGLTPVS